MTLSVFCGPMNLPGQADVLYHNRGNDSVPNLLFHNNRDGTFTEEALRAGVASSGIGRAQAGMGIDAGDYDGDGHLDLIVTNFSHDYNTLYENSGSGFFTDVSHVTGIARGAAPYMGWGSDLWTSTTTASWIVFVANGHVYPDIDRYALGTTYLQRKQLFRNLGNKRFQNITDETGGGLLLKRSSRGAAFGDYDNDGKIDVLQMAEVRGDGSYLSHNDVRAHFGLGSADRVQAVEIRWPSGRVDTMKELAADRFYVAVKGQGVQPNPPPSSVPARTRSR